MDVFCLTCAVLTVFEFLKEQRGFKHVANAILPADIVPLIEHHAYNRTAKAAKEWCNNVKDNSNSLQLGFRDSKCTIL